MNPSPTSRGRLPLQSLLYALIKVLSLVGAIVALICGSLEVAVVWMLSLGVANVVLIRLPPRWFGDKREAVESTDP
jgi:hypothetical protein